MDTSPAEAQATSNLISMEDFAGFSAPEIHQAEEVPDQDFDADIEAFAEREEFWQVRPMRTADHAAPSADIERLLATLNPEQHLATTTTEGPVLVDAGAGSGKTRVLTTRIAYILMTGRAQAKEILAVTFTNKASQEMRERIQGMVGEAARSIRMGSFHSVSMAMLRHHAVAAGLRDDRFMILDEADQKKIVENIVRDMGLTPEDGKDKGKAWKQLVDEHHGRLQNWKEEGWSTDIVRDHVDATDGDNRLTLAVYDAYQEALTTRNACDFADLLLHMLRLFRTDARIRAYWGSKFRYILVDEFQDTNPLQYAWISCLAKLSHNLCVVGDLNQSIYRWNNARPEIMLGFPEDWKGCKIITVDRNYRSTQEILDVANAVISHNPQQTDKRLRSNRHGSKPRLDVYDTDQEEARSIALQILDARARGIPLSEIAILLRSAGPMRGFEEQLIRHQIPYFVVGGMKFHQREEVKDALAYLRLALDPTDELSFLRVCNKPARNIGEATALQVVQALRSGASDLAVACRRVSEHGTRIRQSTRVELEQLATLIDEFSEMLRDGAAPGDLLLHMLERIGYISWRVSTGDEDVAEREESLKELIRDANEYPDIPAYLQTISLLAAADVKDSEQAVRISTIHAAKGLEFHLVFAPALEEGILPNARALLTSYGLQEERCIVHVEWTRPKQELVVSYARSRYYQPAAPSRFLVEGGLVQAAPQRRPISASPGMPAVRGFQRPASKIQGEKMAGLGVVAGPAKLRSLLAGKRIPGKS